LAPQGYLIVNGDELIVPCSTAYPGRLDRKTGELIEFELPAPGGLPGGWFASLDPETMRAVRRGKLTYDDVVNSQLHEDKVRVGEGSPGVSRMIRTGDRTLKFDAPLDGVEGTIHSMIVANERLFVSSRSGKIFCFGEAIPGKLHELKTWSGAAGPGLESLPEMTKAETLIKEAGGSHGIAVVAGLRDGMLVRGLTLKSNFHVIAIDDDPGRVDRLRRELQDLGLYGTRAAVIQADPRAISLPPYLANLITTETPARMADSWSHLLPSLRPYGGIADLGVKAGVGIATADKLKTLDTGGFELKERDGLALIQRVGALPGSAQYEGGYEHCEDTLVRFPLGVLWFDDTLSHFKRSPQPQFMDGVMVSRPKNWQATRIKGDWSIDYPLHGAVLSDMYTGRVLHESEVPALRKTLPDIGRSAPQPSYYHAPHQKTYLNPDPPLVGERVNPMTGLKEPRVFPKTYGCDGGVDYGFFYTLRSGTAALYDKTLESGTVFISGPRSGCTNSIIPSGGLLNVPYFYEGCTCSYPLPSGLAMVAMPETFEQWAAWGEDPIAPDSIQRIGLNFGAPGDRTTRDGTLWLDYPSVGGPSPKIRVETIPEKPAFHYRHSLWMKGGEGWPWVGASAVEGLRELKLRDLKPGSYTVLLHFAETEGELPGARRQNIYLQGKVVLQDFDILEHSKQPLIGIVRRIDGVKIDGSLALKLDASAGKTLISGIELHRKL
jgi:malectin (di-glucose binding ER protein)